MDETGFLRGGPAEHRAGGCPPAGLTGDAAEGSGCSGLADLIAGFLLGDRSRCCVAGAAARRGIVALSCVVAGRAWADWRDGCDPVAEASGGEKVPLGLDTDAAEGLCERLLQAMVAAAKSGGRVCREERRFIHRRLRELDLDCEAQALIAAELEAPQDAGRIARLARTPEEAAGIYAASLLAAGFGSAAEGSYLADLAARLKLEVGLVAHLHNRAAAAGSATLGD
ncbi:tellurite resistance TerB family protein [Cereibacter sphaeroides]|uniref:tellurite resistance TerB family protein n=1 Tax=Cereibacter sphaeroides TaxID=1063 RepID=UPI000E5C0D68|nr:tellurite resistance TerB family protein [Cereibacter sphaeroides]RHZ96670.1 tellurite resistance TerB family protein [Cereibacter sphaeroides]